jgi:hypothetical protein
MGDDNIVIGDITKRYLIVKTISLTKEYYWYSDYMLTLDASKGDLYTNEASLLILKKNPQLKRRCA